MARHLGPGHATGLLQLIGQMRQPVLACEALEIRQNVQYPFILHGKPRFKAVNVWLSDIIPAWF
jgi:3-polyprenyl-4-hydroxybenzoate decarboxylase